MPLHWYLEAHHYTGRHSFIPIAVDLSSAATTQVAREEAAAVERSSYVIGRLAAALLKQENTFFMLNCHALAEALPEVVVQLLAVSIVDSPPMMLHISIALSLTAVLTKVSYFCLSCSIRVFAVKLLFLLYDALSLVYMLSALISRDDDPNHRNLSFFSSNITMSALGYLWAVKEACFVCLLILAGIGMLVGFIVAHFLGVPGMQLTSREVRCGFFIVCICVLGLLPAVVVLESFKLTYLIMLLFSIEPYWRGFDTPWCALLVPVPWKRVVAWNTVDDERVAWEDRAPVR